MSKRVLFEGALVNMYDIGIDEVIIQKGDVTMKVMREDCVDLLKRYDVPENVMKEIGIYFQKELPEFNVLKVKRASEHPDDDYLYHVIAKNGDSYACWTCWNQSTKCLNYGHYNLDSKEVAEEILDEFYHTLI